MKLFGKSVSIQTRLELWWLAHGLLDILHGRAEEIRVQSPGDLGNGVEFELLRAGVREHHSVRVWKRFVKPGDSLSLKQLKEQIRAARRTDRTGSKPGRADKIFVVASPYAGELDRWTRAALKCNKWPPFDRLVLHGGAKPARAAEVLGCKSEDECLDLLRRISVQYLDDESLRREVTVRTASLVDGDEQEVIGELVRFALRTTKQALTAQHLCRIPRSGSGKWLSACWTVRPARSSWQPSRSSQAVPDGSSSPSIPAPSKDGHRGGTTRIRGLPSWCAARLLSSRRWRRHPWIGPSEEIQAVESSRTGKCLGNCNY